MKKEEKSNVAAHSESTGHVGRRELFRLLIGAVSLFSATLTGIPTLRADDLDISNRLSPKNKKRAKRPHTLYIVLHTTEGKEKGSLNEVVRYGETHYFVALSGHVYRIIDKNKIATHAGRSMWEGHRNIDNYSIGIEVSGYHNRDITEAQYRALRELLRQLQGMYHIADDHVLTHSMVAYGRPNRFQSGNHRGRKRCGMLFANPEVRKKMGLTAKPERDADVEAGRLTVGDRKLFSYLFHTPSRSNLVAVAYAADSDTAPMVAPAESNVINKEWTAWRIARDLYDDPGTTYVFPNGMRFQGDEIKDWSMIPRGTQVLLAEASKSQTFEGFKEIGKNGDTAWELAGKEYDDATSIYFFPNGLIRTGAELKSSHSTRRLLDHLPKGTRIRATFTAGMLKPVDIPHPLPASNEITRPPIIVFPTTRSSAETISTTNPFPQAL